MAIPDRFIVSFPMGSGLDRQLRRHRHFAQLRRHLAADVAPGDSGKRRDSTWRRRGQLGEGGQVWGRRVGLSSLAFVAFMFANIRDTAAAHAQSAMNAFPALSWLWK